MVEKYIDEILYELIYNMLQYGTRDRKDTGLFTCTVQSYTQIDAYTLIKRWPIIICNRSNYYYLLLLLTTTTNYY